MQKPLAMIVASTIKPEEKVITRVHLCEKCFAKAGPSTKNRGITPHYIWFHRTAGFQVLYFASCQVCDCKVVNGRDGLPRLIERDKRAHILAVHQWNALVIFNDDGY